MAVTTKNPTMSERMAERRKNATPVEFGTDIHIVAGKHQGALLTINHELFDAVDLYHNPPMPPEPEIPTVVREATCRSCTFTAQAFDHEDQSGLEFRVWNHEQETRGTGSTSWRRWPDAGLFGGPV